METGIQMASAVLGLIIAICAGSLAVVGVVVGMMFWVRSEANSLRQDQKEDRDSFFAVIGSIQEEMKDFHQRLLEIEKARK